MGLPPDAADADARTVPRALSTNHQRLALEDRFCIHRISGKENISDCDDVDYTSVSRWHVKTLGDGDKYGK